MMTSTETFKVIIAGSRYVTDYKLIEKVVDFFLNKKVNICDKSIVEIVSGGASGVDSLGEKYAEKKGYKLTIFHANWDKYGLSAGPIRNAKMASYADALVAFPLHDSKGTYNMIKLAKKKNLIVHSHELLS